MVAVKIARTVTRDFAMSDTSFFFRLTALYPTHTAARSRLTSDTPLFCFLQAYIRRALFSFFSLFFFPHANFSPPVVVFLPATYIYTPKNFFPLFPKQVISDNISRITLNGQQFLKNNKHPFWNRFVYLSKQLAPNQKQT